MSDWGDSAQMDASSFGGAPDWNPNTAIARGSTRGRIGVRGRGRGNFSTSNTSSTFKSESSTLKEKPSENNWGAEPVKESNSWGAEPVKESNSWGAQPSTESNSWGAQPSTESNSWGAQPTTEPKNWGSHAASSDWEEGNDTWAEKKDHQSAAISGNTSSWNEKPSSNGWGDGSRGGSKSAARGSDAWGSNDNSSSWGGGSDFGRSSGRGRGGSRACFKCNEEGHMSRDCPSGGGGRGGGSRACFKCNEEGHMSRDCPSGGGGRGGGSGGSRACFKCNEEGHMSRECPNAEPRKSGCHNCGGEGHFIRDCPEPRKPRGGGSFRGNRNSGEDGNSGWGNKQDGETTSWDNKQDSGNGGWASKQDSGDGGWSSSQNGMGRGRGGRGGSSPRGGGSSSRGCFKCGEEGHMSRECPSGGGGEKSGGGCHNCGQEGHFARECTEPRKERPPTIGEDGEEKPAPVTYVPVEREVDDLFNDGVDAGIHFTLQQKIPVTVTGDGEHPVPIREFGQANLRSLIMENVKKARYSVPTPIQQYAIPIIKSGRDMMACAQTGSGKTAGFLLPILHYIMENEADCTQYDTTCHPVSLIVAPTRELAIQIYDEARKFCNGSIVKVCVIYGGTAVFHQRKSIQNGCHILVATPGRLGDFIDKCHVSLDSIKFLVLDEADRMLDMGFIGEIKKLVNNPEIPRKEDRQTLMFSATFPTEIQNLASSFLQNYLFVAVGMVGAANSDVKQIILNMNKNEKRDSILGFINEKVADDSSVKILVFVDKKRNADFLAAFLSGSDVKSTSIHGDRMQVQREEALRDFKRGSKNVLVATAVAARGLDIKGVGYVVNFDLPKEIDEYVHRIGRTGRVGNIGHAISYFDAENDLPLSKDLIKVLSDAQQDIPDFLRESASGMGSVLSYEGAYTSTDIRSRSRNAPSHYEHTQAPMMVVAEEDPWN